MNSSSSISAPYLLFALLVLMCVLVYLPGLSGPFLFDDHAHIRLNSQVHIADLSVDSLSQAWSSSLAKPPSDRPLAQLTFGINHVFSGLSTWGFKATNLAIHIINGWLIFLLSMQLVATQRHPVHWGISDPKTQWFALSVAAVWLLHPLNLTSVLYVVQRMNSLSTLFVLVGLWLYVSGRIQLAENKPGKGRILAAFPVAFAGIFAKENAALFPVLVLLIEFTLLRQLSKGSATRFVNLVIALGAGLPVVLGTMYLLLHPELYSYAGRQFTMEERVLTQARALWFYLQLLVSPVLQQMALFHDDFVTSQGWLTPLSTLLAVIAWMLVLVTSVIYAKRYPVLAFGVLFYLGAHSLESGIIPLEMVFEHRNYLPMLGPVFALLYWLFSFFSRSGKPWFGLGLGLLLFAAFSLATHARVLDWSTAELMTLSEVEHHPESKRANFKAAQLYMEWMNQPDLEAKAYAAARTHFEKLDQLDPGHPNALFGLIVLNLFVQQMPEQEWVDRLVFELEHKAVDATRLSMSQFSFLVRWHMQGGFALPPEQMASIFDAIAKNPRMGRPGKAGVFAARAAYLDKVLGMPELAREYAERAVEYWPDRWHYRKRYAQLLLRLQQPSKAAKLLQKGVDLGLSKNQQLEAEQLIAAAGRDALESTK